MKKVIVVGGGWSGCAAAISARKAGAVVTVLERTDMLLGTGLVGGIMRNNGRYTATEEIIAKVHGEVMKHMLNLGINIIFKARITKLEQVNGNILSVEDGEGNIYEGDVFIDATDTAGPMNNCTKYGNGCAMCILRCPGFGGRVSITGLVGIKESMGAKADGSIGAMSGSCKLYKESLSEEIQNELNEKWVAVVPVPNELVEDHLGLKACQQYALAEFSTFRYRSRKANDSFLRH